MRILPKNPNGEAVFASQQISDGTTVRDTASRAGVLGLIVTCEECSTSFQLDEARIPASGAQVRCSRCKHAFFLPAPSSSQSDAAHSIAEEAARDSTANVPPVTPDASDLAPRTGSGALAGEPDEEEWQFSEEVRIEGDEDLGSGADFGTTEDLGGGFDADALMEDLSADGSQQDDPTAADSGAGLGRSDLEAATESGLELDSNAESTESVRDESAFGSVDDFSSLMEDDDVAPVDLGGDEEPGLGRAEANSPSVGFYASNGATDDLGDPESWDLVGSDDFGGSKPVAHPTRAAFQDEAAGPGVGFADEPDELVYDEDLGSTSRLWRGLASACRGIGWLATLATIVAVLVLGFRAEWMRWEERPQTVSRGAFTAETTGASWLETSRSGFVLVVEGQIRNTGNTPVWPGSVQVAWLDAAGERLSAPPILAGARMNEALLRESSPQDLAAGAGAAVSTLRATPLSPGEARPFAVVAFEDAMPERARRVLLEISESAPAVPALSVRDQDQVESELGVEADTQVEEESDFSP